MMGWFKSERILSVLLIISLFIFLSQYFPWLVKPKTGTPVSRPLSRVETFGQTEKASLEVEVVSPVEDPFALRIPVRRIDREEALKQESSAAYVPKPALSLGGVWIYGRVKYALIGDDSVAEGGSVEGWRVESIQKGRVVLAKKGQRKILQLEE